MTNPSEPGAGGKEPLPILHVAAAALVDARGRILLAERPVDKAMAGLWEFPGGKVEDGETPEAALIRELGEELGITVEHEDLIPCARAAHDYQDFHLDMPLFLCRRWRGTPQPREGQLLAWVLPSDLSEYEMPPADAPLVAKLMQRL